MSGAPTMLGPCVICGAVGYGLSCGGPTICPKCDCGHFDTATVQAQAKTIGRLREALQEIDRIVHTPTKETGFRSADRHYQSDFDAIRKLTAPYSTVVPRPQHSGDSK